MIPEEALKWTIAVFVNICGIVIVSAFVKFTFFSKEDKDE